ncbi:hypothetical protein [Amphritea japonica]|uniref:Uncharacterized protein n=1 Tax=Amphritea japonica ATCC BAA-1530 TaxID=1278309 RepID=A0A7R6PCY2_9GAMM|nr:hypothetical protein [Amphritea japonica]BBB26766.1 conserved hypothetical protein [Amphritea japonica ATCC BAA-1530]
MSCFTKLKRQCGDGAHKAALGCSLLFASVLAVSTAQAQQVSINVVTPDPVNPSILNPVDGFRWLIEEDTTWDIKPGVPTGKSLSTGFHSSYSPLAGKGESAIGNINPVVSPDLDASKRYYISVTPHTGYTIGGAEIKAGVTSVDVIVNPLPLPTAQISILVFEDFSPINGAPDLPEEDPAISVNQGRINDPDGGEFDPTQFRILLEEAGGRYGATGGAVTQDAFGNLLGTEYEYDIDGNAVLVDGAPVVLVPGNGVIQPAADGSVLIKNLAPAKYGVIVVPPTGGGWLQTGTIEGSKVIDAWVMANEPSYFTEFGPPGFHVFTGFQKAFEDTAFKTDNFGSATITGQVVNNHMSRPPELAFYNGEPFPGCWVGLNQAGGLPAIEAQPCDEDSNFSFTNVPPGTYELAIWDDNLDIVLGYQTVTVPGTPNAIVDVAEIPVFNWFTKFSSSVFNDLDGDGFRDPNEGPMGADSTAVNLRFRNGTVYQSFAVDTEGEAPFDEVFPFFHWLVAEVDFATLKATGATYVVDNGGEVRADAGWDDPTFDTLTPQPQFCTQARIDNAVDAGDAACVGATAGDAAVNPHTGNNLSTTLQGQVLTLGVQSFLGQTNRIEFGKQHYPDGENGGISGLVLYAITRAENDPRYAAAEEWEPGIPRVQLNLYKDSLNDGIIDSQLPGGGNVNVDVINGVSLHRKPDVDRHPLGNFPGPEDTDQGPADGAGYTTGVFDNGDAIQVTWTDSWDDANPNACQGETYTVHAELGAPDAFTTDCHDGLRNFNQVTNGLFDGGYAFNDIATGVYIVESVMPEGYELLKEEDRNVDYGDAYVPSPLQLPPECVGDEHLVPPFMSYMTDENGDPLDGSLTADEAPFAGQIRPLCDRKIVLLGTGKNAAADFFMFTDVPIAAHVVGGILDDTANEFDPNSPNFGEKYAPPWLPVSFRDWTGREVLRTYSDEWGKFNALVPSSFTVNLPIPTGLSPNMLSACMNDASPKLVNGKLEKDPFHNPQYSQFCYTFQYAPGSTTYLDTPVVPVSAFAGPDQFALDCELPTTTPGIFSVNSSVTGGPAAVVGTEETITITSLGNAVEVANPEYDGTSATPKTIFRDYSFGAVEGTVTLGGVDINTIASGAVSTWSEDTITFTVPLTATTGQLEVISATGEKAPNGVTLNIIGAAETVAIVTPSNNLTDTPIQDAIDAATAGDLILVSPGAYHELVIMHKPVRLQGFGAASTSINAVRSPTSKVEAWRNRIYDTAGTEYDLLPGQVLGGANAAGQLPIFGSEEGPGIFVVGNIGEFATATSRIDGIAITGAVQGGGILVGGYVDNLEISNNDIYSNAGSFGGGIRSGYPTLTNLVNGDQINVDSENNNLNIHNNKIVKNGGNGGAGGGVALYTGSDNYQITNNLICGNFTQGNGAGIGHLGLSNNGLIADNTIAYNQSFNQGLEVNGGGIFIGGKEGLEANNGGLQQTPGTGSVLVETNKIMGNQAGAGSGGGISLNFVNGADVTAAPLTSSLWHSIALYDNIIVNNVAGRDGGGVALRDASAVSMVHNTIAYNDSTSTVAATFNTGSDNSAPQPGAGIASRIHSAGLESISGQTHSDPELVNNIIYRNRSFSWVIDSLAIPQKFALTPDISNGESPIYSDISVVDNQALSLSPRNSLLTKTTENAVYTADPMNANKVAGLGHVIFTNPLPNGQPGQTLILEEGLGAFNVAAALDEGGNFIDVRFGPLTLDPVLIGSYRLANDPTNKAIDNGQSDILTGNASLAADFFGTSRFYGAGAEIGAEELALGAIPVAVDDSRRVAFAGPSTSDLQAFVLNINNLLLNDINHLGWTTTVPVVGSETGGGVLSWNDLNANQFAFRTPTGAGSVGQFSFQYKDTASPLTNTATVTLTKDISVMKALARTETNGDHRWRINGYSTFPKGTSVRLYLNGTASGAPFAQWNLTGVNGRWFYHVNQGTDPTGITKVSVRIGNRVLKNIPLQR